jgi:hypothetical protein
VKSTTRANETRQLRLGLGQVLHYGMALARPGREIRAILAAEREPADPRWVSLCASHSVSLVWPGVFDRLIPERDGGPGPRSGRSDLSSW